MTATELFDLLKKLGIQKLRQRNQNIMGCCPAHADQKPSWGISVSPPHLHGCFSCGFRGTLRSLLLHHGWTLAAANNLLGKTEASGALSWGAVSAKGKLPSEEEIWPFVLEPAAIRYMLRRGISYKTLKAAGVLFHALDQRVLFPWFYNGVFHGATGRSIDPHNQVKIQAYWDLDKRSCLYIPLRKGIIQRNEPLVLTEGEIDALTVVQCGYQAAALGKGSVSDGQLALFESLPVNFSFILCFDSDRVGRKLTYSVKAALARIGRINIREVSWAAFNPSEKWDANQVGVAKLKRLLAEAKVIGFNWQ